MAAAHTAADIDAYITRYFTVPAARRAYEQFWIDSLLCAHHVAPQRWVVTFNPTGTSGHLNINVGLLHTIMLRSDDVQVMVDYAALPPLPDDSDDVFVDVSAPDPLVGIYPSVPGSSYTCFNPNVFHLYAASLWAGHHRTIEKAALTRMNPGVTARNTPAALTYFERAHANYIFERTGQTALPSSHYPVPRSPS